MADVFKKLYDDLALRKGEANATGPYSGGNGRIDRAVELIRAHDFLTGGTLVDIGGATGNLGYALRDLFKHRYVVDIADACRVPAHAKGNTFVQANVDFAGLSMFTNESVDLIVALDFIEHIIDPEKFSAECLRVLKPGGAVLINTPNIQYWRHLESLVVHGNFPHTSGDREVYHGGHVAFYGIKDMFALFPAPSWSMRTHHTAELVPDPSPPIWRHLLNAAKTAPQSASGQLDYADLVFSCRKPE